MGNGAGEYQWRFSRDGYYPAWRRGSIDPENVLHLPAPRLVKKSGVLHTVSALDGGIVGDGTGTIQVKLEPGAVGQNTVASVTPLNGQNLPAFLPHGWSPLQAFWLEVNGVLEKAATVRLKLWANPGNRSTALVRLNESTVQWETVAIVAATAQEIVTAAIIQNGAYAVVAADGEPFAPPAPLAGMPLGGANVPALVLSGLKALGTVTPSSRPANLDPALVTGLAEVVITNLNGPVPSGLVLPGEVSETYKLRSGEERRIPRYRTHTIFYQAPGDADGATLHSRFPVRPSFLFSSEELEEVCHVI